MQLPPPIPAGTPPLLTPEHFRQLAVARTGWKRVRRAVKVARFDGWTIGLFGALTLMFGITTLSGVLLGGGMIAVAAMELRGANRLARLDTGVTRTLGLNQLAVAGMLIAYACWRIHAETTGAGEYDALIAAEPELASMLKPTGDLVRMITVGVYGLLIGVAVFAQGSLALFYFTRAKHIRAYATRTPEWIQSMQRAGVTV